MVSGGDKEVFLDKLYSFKSERGEEVEPPSFAKKAVDEFKLWRAVQEAGGHSEVTANKGWARIGRMFDPPKTMTDLSFRIKKIYETYMLPFEKAVLEGSVQGLELPPRVVQPQTSGATPKARPGRPPKRGGGAQHTGGKRVRQDKVDEMVGKRIRVLWPDEHQFFSGTVTAFDPSEGKHRIDYDDGDEELLDLNTQTWHLLTDLSSDGDGNALRLVDNGGLGQLHSAAEALARTKDTLSPQDGRGIDAIALGRSAAEGGCLMKGDGFKVFETANPEGFEVFCLIPGLQLEEIRVQCWSSGKLLVTRDPKDAQASSAWGIRPLKHKIRLPKAVHAGSARALVTLHGQLYIRIFCKPPLEEAAPLVEASPATPPASTPAAPMEAAEATPARPADEPPPDRAEERQAAAKAASPQDRQTTAAPGQDNPALVGKPPSENLPTVLLDLLPGLEPGRTTAAAAASAAHQSSEAGKAKAETSGMGSGAILNLCQVDSVEVQPGVLSLASQHASDTGS